MPVALLPATGTANRHAYMIDDPPPDAARPGRRRPMAIGLAVAMVLAVAAYGALVSYATMVQPGVFAADFTWPWRGARALLAGLDPYAVVRPTGPYPFDANFKYPLPAALLALPVAGLPAILAGTAFATAGAALLAFGVARVRPALWPMFFSKQFYSAAALGQWSTFLTAGALVPSLSIFWAAKPTLAVALFAAYPSRRAFWGAVALCAIAAALVPAWPLEWLAAIRADPQRWLYVAPVTVYAGPLLILSALRWRRPEARLLLVLSCVPHALSFYDELALFLVATTVGEAAVLTAGGWAAMWIVRLTTPNVSPLDVLPLWRPYAVAFIYLPCLVMVLRRPNSGDVPAWVDRAAARGAALGRALLSRGRGAHAP